MNKCTYDSLLSIINMIDKKDSYKNREEITDDNTVAEALIPKILSKESSILGIDIYEYSQYDSEKQSLIPFAFDLIRKEAIRLTLLTEQGTFDKYDFDIRFISTGDGGFQVFNTPLQALIFSIHFHAILTTFNSWKFYPRLRHFLGPIVLRSCITTGETFDYNGNTYGPCIIRNARILSKDKLNRFLIDEMTYHWFQRILNGLESITELSLDKIIEITALQSSPNIITSAYFPFRANFQTYYFDSTKNKLKNCHVQKIGTIKAKKDDISIFNVTIQYYAYLMDENDASIGEGMVITIGNSNPAGIA